MSSLAKDKTCGGASEQENATQNKNARQSKKAKKTTAKAASNVVSKEENPLFKSLGLVDSVLQFLTRATGQTLVPLKGLLATVPKTKVSFEDLESLLQYGILQVHPSVVTGPNTSKDAAELNLSSLRTTWELGKSALSSEGATKFKIGFPNPDDQRLSGSTKTAAKRRVAALKRKLKETAKNSPTMKGRSGKENYEQAKDATEPDGPSQKDWTLPVEEDPDHEVEPLLAQEQNARMALKEMLGLAQSKTHDLDSLIPNSILPRQISYAGSHVSQAANYDRNKNWMQNLDSRVVRSVGDRQLYSHQANAIESAIQNIPTMVCTGTGSGKSLCFLIPVLNAAIQRGERSMLLFPTKALAQDQVVKLQAWLTEHDLDHAVRAATLDGDTPHSQRVDICTYCNVILTNPDTLHAAIMPNWKHLYRPLLSNLRYVVIDEAHMYTGVFGAHVSMILARLYRLVCLQEQSHQPQIEDRNSTNTTVGRQLCFLAFSATLAHPEAHFRLLCCIPKDQLVNVVKEDGSPRAAKHFFVWNPPILDHNGKSIGKVERYKRRPGKKNGKQSNTNSKNRKHLQSEKNSSKTELSDENKSVAKTFEGEDYGPIDISKSRVNAANEERKEVMHRRHSADETALLMALAVSRGIRCIAFCKTRCLVEWVYERTMSALKQSPKTADLCKQVESYRGGYTKMERRQIEERLFHNQLLGVVGTSALELGVDIGGVDLTLHCGFPSSHENLIQQSGRAGRGANASTSLAICICFNSPMDQHLWRHPSSLLSRGFSAPLSMPIYPGLVQGHLLCAGQEFPLAGSLNPSAIQAPAAVPAGMLSDRDLFGSAVVYDEALDTLVSQGSLCAEKLAIASRKERVVVYKTHPSIKNPWAQVSIRSIEPVSYQIVDTSHPRQGGRTDGIHDEAAVLDTMPYSRVFYHAFPGAIITHRNRRYKIDCMNRPPAFGRGFRGSVSLGAFAKPCNLRYYTRPLSNLKITVVKQMERVDVWGGLSKDTGQLSEASKVQESSLPDVRKIYAGEGDDPSYGSFAGCGIVTIKRNVHGYKKLSMVTREEISRSELSLPDMEFDSFAFWLDCHAEYLSPKLGEMPFCHGIHALSHAVAAVAPLFVPCTSSDVQCNHAVHSVTRVTIFDARPGGSGICAQLWKCVFIPNGIVEAAVDLLRDCPSCSDDRNYDGGCPACLHAGECIKFNDYLSKSSGLVIGEHLLNRLKNSELYIKNSKALAESQEAKIAELDEEGKTKDTSSSNKLRRITKSQDISSPRRSKRERAMRHAKDIVPARHRQVVVGRPSWPMDRSDGPKQEGTGE